MTTLSYRVATTQRQLDDAVRIRWDVFGRELGMLDGALVKVPREVNSFDTLETTVHIIVYADDEPVATSRLLLPNPEVARLTGGRLGIDLERKVELSDVGGAGQVFAEITRFCVLNAWRRGETLLWLQAGVYQESRRLGVTHWLASANMETDSAEDARILFLVAAHRGLLSTQWRARALSSPRPPESPSTPVYTPDERERAHRGQLEGLRLSPVLSLFSRKVGARFIAEPLYDAGFRRFSLPLVVALNEIPASTLALFDAVTVQASHA
ncbi:GNAT family N-acyltransferase [Melittangium boletus]|uniref:GNAT family N-acetyltransferase n=1 Tax=Melittangium boletus DSM 14713 TaxID=1294270 RepID=A0A250IBY5_9BACT|nr:GNAT family N-acyltransferase [Melittangium boletus]ATB28661.1 hypothetical protein MEBOL_002110 [Melittangium boletus DSM 14713]